MLGKIVQLLGVPLEDGFRVVEGVKFYCDGIANLRFATLQLGYSTLRECKITYCHQFYLDKQEDGFKHFSVNNLGLKDGMPEENEVEERLWVIIPYSLTIETTAQRIAGRYPHEAILEMKAGDTVKVKKIGAASEIYIAVQVGNELFLIKKNR
jgi:hypothetical protein